MDLDRFVERAAIMEFCGGMSRFEAETKAAAEQGYKRHEVLNEIRIRHSERSRDHGQAVERHNANNLPGVQRNAAQQDGPMPKRDVQGGRDRVELLALRNERG